MAFTFDGSNNLLVNIAAGGSGGSNPAAGPTGSPVPADASYEGFNSGGNLVGVSTANPLPVAQQGNVTVVGTGTLAVQATLPAGQAVELLDSAGTNKGTIKAASTQAAATDTSLVVQLNPNQPNLTTGLNVTASIAAAQTLATVSTITNPVKIEGNAGGILDAATGTAVPANAIQIAGTDGANLRAISTDTSGVVQVNDPTGNLQLGALGPYCTIVQTAPLQSSSSATSLTCTFPSNVTKGNNIVVFAMSGAAAVPSAAKGTGTATIGGFVSPKQSATAPAFNLEFCKVATSGSLTITGTFTTASCALICYEVAGMGSVFANTVANYDSIQSSQGTATSATLVAFNTVAPGDLPFLMVGLASGTVSSSTIAPTSPINEAIYENAGDANNVAVSASDPNFQTFFLKRLSNGWSVGQMAKISPAAGFSASVLFSAVYICFRPLFLNVGGTVSIQGTAGTALDQANGSAVPTNGLQVGGGSVAGGTNFTVLTVKAASVAAAATDTSLVVQPLVGSHVMNTAAAGTQLVGIVGNTAATLDASLGAATAPTNGIATLVENVTTAPSLATGQTVAAQCDYQGSLFVKPYRRGQTVGKATTISSTTATAIVTAPAAGIFADLASLVITVTPQATTGEAFTVSVSDGTNTYIYDLFTGVSATLAATQLIATFNPPIPATTAATAWNATVSTITTQPTIHVTTVAVLQKAS